MEDQQEEVILKVSACKDAGYAKRVAGAMTWRLREQGFFKARAIKQDAINSATKAVAICNQRVAAAGVVLSMELFFSKAENPEGNVATAIEMTVQETDAVRPETFIEYKVSGKQDHDKNAPMKLAEALAAPARENKGICMKCIGPGAVYRAMMAATIARGLIYPNGYNSIVVPNWDSLPQENDLPPISLIKLEFWGKSIGP